MTRAQCLRWLWSLKMAMPCFWYIYQRVSWNKTWHNNAQHAQRWCMLSDDHTSYHLEVWYWTKSARLIVWLWHHPFEFTQKAGMLLRGGGSDGMYRSPSFVATPQKKPDCYQHNQEDVETKLVLTREQHQMYLICFAICVSVVAKKKGLSSNTDVLLIVFRLEWWNMLYKVAVI